MVMDMDMVLDMERHGYRPSFSGSFFVHISFINTVWYVLRSFSFKESSAIY